VLRSSETVSRVACAVNTSFHAIARAKFTDCDLLIVHQDEIEAFLAAFFGQTKPEIVGNDYLNQSMGPVAELEGVCPGWHGRRWEP